MIPYGRHHVDEADIQAVVDVLRGRALTQGPMVDAFEKAIADFVGAKYAVAMSSATAGLHLAALAAGVGPGKTLITSPITFVASANAGVYCGGQIAFADIDPATVNMCPASLQEAVSKHTNVRAVIPVHFAGLPCDMPAIKKAADSGGAVVIEDAAHALGATYPGGKRVGCCSHSLMTVFSFHPVKAIAAGEGGMITTNDEPTYRKLLRLRSHGINKANDPLQLPDQSLTAGEPNLWYYEMQELGFHYRITDIQCALGLSQFKKLERFLARRRELVAAYDRDFAGMKTCAPAQRTGRELSGHHLYVLRADFAAAGTTRPRVMAALKSRGIGTQVHYIPVPAHPFYQRMGLKPADYPRSQEYYRSALSIPLFYDLTNAQQKQVVEAVRELLP
ncbi:MAG: UDP-4-amino-4,6-dideoxy-N-acetyl-beta-L-altrosamine transaminase [Planctomycetes bacterium]|nr:UDP-4-amino-4,6-dideoxy-N-acetyl-beta-L-altrosamine transaminase [Planctomycetota bacterium]